MATVLGDTALRQLARMVRTFERDYSNAPKPDQNLPPISESLIVRFGILTADLVGQTTTAVLANEQAFSRNTATSGSRGSWVNVLDSGGQPVKLNVIEYLLPATKKIPSGKKVVCIHVADDICIPIASECPIAV
jgi:hypothetical protein